MTHGRFSLSHCRCARWEVRVLLCLIVLYFYQEDKRGCTVRPDRYQICISGKAQVRLLPTAPRRNQALRHAGDGEKPLVMPKAGVGITEISVP